MGCILRVCTIFSFWFVEVRWTVRLFESKTRHPCELLSLGNVTGSSWQSAVSWSSLLLFGSHLASPLDGTVQPTAEGSDVLAFDYLTRTVPLYRFFTSGVTCFDVSTCTALYRIVRHYGWKRLPVTRGILVSERP